MESSVVVVLNEETSMSGSVVVVVMVASASVLVVVVVAFCSGLVNLELRRDQLLGSSEASVGASNLPLPNERDEREPKLAVWNLLLESQLVDES